MTIDIVPDVPMETRLTTAHGGVRPVTRGIVIHATRGPTYPEPGEALVDTLDREYHVAVAYMLNPANEVSPHFCVGPRIVCRMVHDDNVAWHAQQHNQTHLGIEVAQPSYQPEFVEFEYLATAEICAHWCLKYAIPPVRVMDSDLAGIIGHEQTDQGRRDGKTDPGWRWDWPKFMFLVQEKVREFGMSPAEKAQIDQQTRAIFQVLDGKLIPLCDEYRRAIGPSALEEAIRALHGDLWAPTAKIRQVADLP